MSDIAASPRPSISAEELAALERIERRVLWLAVRIVDYANRERPKQDELKVGGHQASSASMVSLMTALYLWDLRAEDRVSVKPHASPVLHAIEYLLGRLPREYLTTLRAYRRAAVLPVPDEGSLPGRLLDRLRRSRRRRAALRRARPTLRGGSLRPAARERRRPLHLAPRRRRARRGQPLGGRARAQAREPRQRALDRRPEPPVARPRRADHQGGRAGAAVRDGGLAGARVQVRPPAPGGLREGGRRAPPPADRRDAEPDLPGALRRERGGGRRGRARRPVARRPPAAGDAPRGVPGRGRPRSSRTWAATTSPTS